MNCGRKLRVSTRKKQYQYPSDMVEKPGRGEAIH